MRRTFIWLIVLFLMFGTVACQPAELADFAVIKDWSGFIALHEGETIVIPIPLFIFNDENFSVSEYDFSIEGLGQDCRVQEIRVIQNERVFGSLAYNIAVFIEGAKTVEAYETNLFLAMENTRDGEQEKYDLGKWVFTIIPQKQHIRIKDYIGKTVGEPIIADYTCVIENISEDEIMINHLTFDLDGLTVAEKYYDYSGILDDNQWVNWGDGSLIIPPYDKAAVMFKTEYTSGDQFGLFLKPIIEYSIAGSPYEFAAPLFMSETVLTENMLHGYRVTH